MSDTISPLSRFNVTAAGLAPSSQTGNLSGLSKSFSDIFAAMMTSSQASLSGSSISNSSSLLFPLMLALLEKMVEQQVGSGQAESDSSSSNSANLTPATNPIFYSGLSDSLVSGASASPSGRPVGGVVTNTFHPGHNGIDFGVPVGTKIQATMGGKVVYAGWNNEGYGNLVIVENGPYRTYFAHLSQIPVKIGQTVSAGEVVGISGNTGNSTGPHLHYEVRNNQKVIDPTSFTINRSG